jgi:hypothetical protein
MSLAYSIHSIRRKGAKGFETIEPKNVFSVTEDEFKELKGLGAVRELTDDERTLWSAANPPPKADKAADKPGGKAAAKEGEGDKKAEGEKAPASDGKTDPVG